ncbi:MAG: hypothetical protein CXZ00_02325 [Acidobacteria bacterium]|nr:MAG: hypothetical protein CXZ00_02325 [Acidobacteriota bacterium]
MTTTVINAAEYRDLPLSQLNESKTNPRRVFDDAALKELAASIRSQGVLSPLIVRPLTETGFEIVAGARRYRAAQMRPQSCLRLREATLHKHCATRPQPTRWTPSRLPPRSNRSSRRRRRQRPRRKPHPRHKRNPSKRQQHNRQLKAGTCAEPATAAPHSVVRLPVFPP